MMGYPNGGNGKVVSPDLVQSHEDRLQNLQSELSGTRAEVSECGVRIDNLGQQMVEGNARVIEQMTAGFDRVFERLDPMQKKIEELDKRQTATSTVVEHLDAKEKVRLSRKQKVKTTLIGLAVAGGSATMGKFGGAIGTWLTKFLGG